MNIAFKIPPVTSDISNLHLLAEAGKEEISFLIFSKAPFALHGLYAYSFKKFLNAEEYAERIRNILAKENMLRNTFASVNIFYNNSESTLVPAEYFSPNDKEQIASLMFGENKTTVTFHEIVKGQNIYNIYRIPEKIHQAINEAFLQNYFSHSTSCQLRNNKAGDVLECTVYHNNIKVILYKAGNLQLVQYFEYSSPSDVCYYLLNSCERFAVSPSVVQVSISGMIDINSNLFKEIYRYFLNVSLLQLPEDVIITDKLNEHPHHFYSHLSVLAQCV